MNIRRREFLCSAGAAGALLAAGRLSLLSHAAPAAPRPRERAQIAITLDLEMSRNFPTWETTYWDYEKGNLDADTKAYSAEAAQRVKDRGGIIPFFSGGRVPEQENRGWVKTNPAPPHTTPKHTYLPLYLPPQ